MPTDIKTTGYQTYRDLQAQNAEAFTPSQPEMSDWYKGFLQRRISDYGDEPTEYVGRQAADAGFGTSKYDQGLVSASQLGDLQDIRYENQPWYDTLANGVVKMLGTAGTTFLSSLIGLPAGAATAVAEGRWSGLWDNDVTQALGDVDDWLENNFKNYKSEAQEQNKWWQNMGTMNWWADDVIKNAGFTLGAAASMATGAGALGLLSKSLGMVNNVSKGAKLANGFVSALFSATGEGMIEARQGVEERNKIEMQKLEDALAPERNAIEMEKEVLDEEYSQTGDFNTYQRKMTDVLRRQQELDNKLEAGRQQIEESGREMGNKILLGNQALLTAGNLIQFGKVMSKSFDRARHAAETSSKTVRPTLARATRVGEDISKGYKAKGKGLGRLYAGSKGLITEGSEEMNQQWIQSSAGAAYNEKDVNDYWRAKLDPDSYRETTRDLYSLGNTINQGFQESWGDFDQWEQFVIGGMTGMAGSYAPTKIFNQDKTKALYDPRRYGEWGGGAYNEIRDFNKEYNQFEENVDDLNKALEDKNFFSRIQSLAARTYAEGKKQEALERGDKKAWKDEDDKQTIHDIQAFLRAGKLDDLRAIYDDMGGDLSDEDVENIIKSTTREVENADGTKSYEGPFVDKEGNHIVSNDEIRKEVKHNSEKLQEKLDSYLDSVDYVNQRTGGQLSKDQEDNLVYLHNMGKESLQRADSIMANVRQQLPAKFLLKTNKTPEQLTQENSSSDLTFSKDEKTKEGYVEVDTSLMNDSAFTDFFLKNILWGGNIRPEFGETADERARREEEEKDLSDEEKRSKRTAKWKKALEDARKDAKEQNQTNVDLMVENFLNNYRKDNRASDAESVEALNNMLEDVADASALLEQHGEFEKTLQEYMANPEKVERAKEKEEKKAEKKNKEEDAKSKFGGKTAKEINQDLNDGVVDIDDLDNLFSLDDVDDEEVSSAQEAAKKAEQIRNKQASLKGKLAEDPEYELANDDVFNAVVDAVDRVAANADDEVELNYDTILDELPTDDLRGPAENMLAAAFESYQKDEDAKDTIPEDIVNEVATESEETGDDNVSTVPSETAAPKTTPQNNSDEFNQPVPKPLTPDALQHITEEIRKANEEQTQNGAWRNTTRRYGRRRNGNGVWYHTRVPYHELVTDKNSTLYKRSKAIWEYLNEEKAWDRVENAGEDRLKANKTVVHFMVKNLSDKIFGKPFEELKEDEKPYALVTIMLNDNGEVLGDLPLAQFEKGYNKEDESKIPQHLKELLATQNKLFKAFEEKRKSTNCNEAIADNTLNKDGVENLGLTFDNRDKSPFVSKVSQVLNGMVPIGSEVNTLNDIMGEENLLLGIAVTGETIAVSKNKKDARRSRVLPVQTGNIGQCYILIPSASGALVPVPFYTKAFNAQRHAGTEFYQMLTGVLTNLVEGRKKGNSASYKEDMDVLEGLLQVRAQEGAKSTVEITKDSITLHLQSLTDATKKMDISVPNTGNTVNDVAQIVNSLSGTNINVSLQYLNSEIGIKGGRRTNYNRMLGEIADANLPKNTTHTLNNGFIIKLTTQAGTKRTGVTYRKSGIHTVTLGDRTILINMDNYTATELDPTTKEEIPVEGDEEVNLLLAKAKASQQADKTKRFTITINGEVRTFDPVKEQFVKTSQGAGVNAGQPSINQQKENRKKEAGSNQSSTTLKTATDSSAVATSKPKEAAAEPITIIKEDNSKGQAGFINMPQGYIKNKHGIWVPVVLSMREGYIFEDGTTVLGGQGKSASYYLKNGVVAIQDGTGDYLELIPDKIVGVFKLGKDDVTHIDITEEIQKEAAAEQQFQDGEVELEIDESDYFFDTGEQSEPKQVKSIEDINNEVKDIINRRNQDAWNTITDEQKLKMVNEGVGIVLEYGDEKVTLDYRDFEDLKEKLKEANKYAKSGSLTVSEGAKYRRATTERQKKINLQRERKWLQDNLPMFNSEERLHLLQGLLEIPGEQQWAWGRFEKGIITLSDMAARGTLYHEAFHAVTQTLLSDEELDTLYEAAVKHYKESNVALVEELLAEDFRRYVQRGETPIIGKILKFFRKIMNAIRNISGYKAPIQQLFYKINNGEFRDVVPREARSGNAFYQKIDYIGRVAAHLVHSDHPLVKDVIERFYANKSLVGSKKGTGEIWSGFKKFWERQNVAVHGQWRKRATGIAGYVLNDVKFIVNGKEEDLNYYDEFDELTKEAVEQHAAKQAREGRGKRLEWDNLTGEQRRNLEYAGFPKEVYDYMSVDEQEQVVGCKA